MEELTIDEKIYVSTKRAAVITGYAKDYVGQLCREGRVEATLVGRSWYVLESAIREQRFGTTTENVESVPAENTEIEETIPSELPNVYSTFHETSYIPEEPVELPALAEKPASEALESVVSEMQSAWQEWFATHPHTAPKAYFKAPEETLEAVFAEEVPLEEEKVEEEPSERNIYVNKGYFDVQPSVLVDDYEPIVREYSSRRHKNASRSPHSVRSSLIARTGVVCALALIIMLFVIASGVVNTFAPRTGLAAAAFDFLNGTAVYAK